MFHWRQATMLAALAHLVKAFSEQDSNSPERNLYVENENKLK
jgi:hypothetical protein